MTAADLQKKPRRRSSREGSRRFGIPSRPPTGGSFLTTGWTTTAGGKGLTVERARGCAAASLSPGAQKVEGAGGPRPLSPENERRLRARNLEAVRLSS